MNRMQLPIVLLTILIILAATNSLHTQAAASDPAAQRDAIETKLKALDAAKVAGVVNEAEYAAKKQALEDELRGLAVDEATRKKLDALEAARKSGILSDAEYEAKKREILGAVAPAAPAVSAAGNQRKGNVHRMSIGASFWYPQGWIVSEQDSLLRLTPPNQQGTADAPTEYYFLGFEDMSAKSIKEPDDPRLLQSLDQQIKGLSPALEQQGKGTVVQARGGKGMMYQWQAATEKGQVHARAYATVIGKHAVVLIALGFKHHLTTREKDMAEIFASLGEDQSMTAGRKGKNYRHAIGFTFWYPADWSTKDMEDFLQLIPPNPGTSPSGPTELYFVLGESVKEEGITKADDRRIADYLDEQVAQISPTLKRTAAPQSVSLSGGTGTVLDWEGRGDQGAILARAYVAVIKDHAIALVALCIKDRLGPRDADLRQMFTSFAFGEPKRDQQLVGTWTYLTTNSMTNWSPFETAYSRAQMTSDTTSSLQIKADGTWQRVRKSHTIAGAGGVWLESKDQTVEKGKWFADDGKLSLIQENDIWEEYSYKLKSDSTVRLLLVSGGKGELWGREK